MEKKTTSAQNKINDAWNAYNKRIENEAFAENIASM